MFWFRAWFAFELGACSLFLPFRGAWSLELRDWHPRDWGLKVRLWASGVAWTFYSVEPESLEKGEHVSHCSPHLASSLVA